MEPFAISLKEFPRLNHLAPPLSFLGCNINDSYRVEWRRETVNIGLILEGDFQEACYERAGVPFRAPIPACAFLSAGETFRQNNPGPCTKLILIYEAEYLAAFPFFAAPERVMTPIPPGVALSAYLAEIRCLAADLHLPGNADKLDLATATLLTEIATHAAEPNLQYGPNERAVRKIAAWVDTHLTEPPDWTALAARHGLSARTFQRSWRHLFACAPGAYLRKRKLAVANRLLTETDLSVKEIARLSGFDDPFYFSRFFARCHGMPPLQYRKRRADESGIFSK